MKRILTNRLSRLLILPLILIGCMTSSAEHKSGDLKGYDLNHPDKFIMPGSLIEISGIAFNHNIGDVVYAIQDEEGKFFKLSWGVKKQTHAKFAKSGDYEDVAIIHDRVVVLKSNGTFYTFNLADADDEDIDHVQEWKHTLPDGEYESLYADEAANTLYVVCKNCDQDKNTTGVSGFTLRFDDSIYRTGSFFIDAKMSGKPLANLAGKGLRPSAMARNPITHEWYVLSSVNKLLFIVDEQWHIREAVRLSPETFNQPEGLAFDAAGNLYISNEGDDVTEGNILKFIRKK